MFKIQQEVSQNNIYNVLDTVNNSDVTRIIFNGKPVKLLVSQPGNVTSLHFNSEFSESEHNNISTDIDYCDSAVNLLCAVEDKNYDVILIDYLLEGVDLIALLKFISEEYPQSKTVVMSAPVWNTSSEKEQITKLCYRCCHEDFYELDLESFVQDIMKERINP